MVERLSCKLQISSIIYTFIQKLIIITETLLKRLVSYNSMIYEHKSSGWDNTAITADFCWKNGFLGFLNAWTKVLTLKYIDVPVWNLNMICIEWSNNCSTIRNKGFKSKCNNYINTIKQILIKEIFWLVWLYYKLLSVIFIIFFDINQTLLDYNIFHCQNAIFRRSNKCGILITQVIKFSLNYYSFKSNFN